MSPSHNVFMAHSNGECSCAVLSLLVAADLNRTLYKLHKLDSRLPPLMLTTSNLCNFDVSS